MPDRDGVEIYQRLYPFPESFRLGDPVLACQITGMTWPEFTEALRAQEDAYADAREMGLPPPPADQIVLSGMIAVAFWQGNPHMSRDKARRALERIPMEDIELIDGDDGEVDIGPPAQGGLEAAPTISSSESASSPEQFTETTAQGFTSDETIQNGSGSPPSPTTSQESLPA